MNDLELQPSTGEIFAATYGRGIWRTNQQVDNVKSEPFYSAKIEIYPNPVSEQLFIKFNDLNNFKSDNIEIKILDIRGAELFRQNVNLTNEIKLTPGLPNRIYFISFFIDGKEYSGKFIVNK